MPTINDLTIAIITYRRPKELERCLSSIKQQKYQPKKVLIIDSLVRKTNIPESRNIALDKCQTKYLAFVDDDCILTKNWTINAYRAISLNSNLSFVVGKTNLLNKHNLIAQIQYKNYLSWFNQYNILDTKNVIFNYLKIKYFRFDTSFSIFEDVDFHLQLKFHNLTGSYNPNMNIYHPEVGSLFKAIKKNYIRGQYKAKITQKWGGIDDFIPSLPRITNPINFLLQSAFYYGYIKNPPRLTTIVNNLDKGANEQRLMAIYRFLRNHHHNINIINSQSEFEKVIFSKKYLLIYGWSLLNYKVLRFIHDRIKINRTTQIILASLSLRGQIIHRILSKTKATFAIIQYPEDLMVICNLKRQYQTLYDSTTIYYQELASSNQFSLSFINTLKKIESNVYELSDYVSFHWYSYFDLAKSYNLKINHPLSLNWGCQTQAITASYKIPIKIIHLGKLNAYWVNPPLLSTISQHINLSIFSYELPDKKLYSNLRNFKGYLKNEDRIANYQFGLISLSKDKYRSQGFSAKYLMYLSYGLPVLCPEWRRDKLLTSATIYYNETNIIKLIKKYSEKKLWLRKHFAALKIAKKLQWSKTLKPLASLPL